MDVTLTASNKAGFVALGLTDESGGMVGDHSVVGILEYNIIVNYELKGYSDQSTLLYTNQTLMDAYVEAIDGYTVI